MIKVTEKKEIVIETGEIKVVIWDGEIDSVSLSNKELLEFALKNREEFYKLLHKLEDYLDDRLYL